MIQITISITLTSPHPHEGERERERECAVLSARIARLNTSLYAKHWHRTILNS